MKYVIDANVALRWVLNEAYSEQAIALREAFRRGVCELLAPEFFPLEVANALNQSGAPQGYPPGAGKPVAR